MTVTLINPKDLAAPRGYSHGAMGSGRVLYVAGQIGWDEQGRFVSDDLVAQFERALASVVRVLHEAGARPEDVLKLNLYVLDKREYQARSRDIGAAYRKHMGRHFPAMTLAEVKGLFDEGAKVEIEAVAVVP